jgi:hypothetical protein
MERGQITCERLPQRGKAAAQSPAERRDDGKVGHGGSLRFSVVGLASDFEFQISPLSPAAT